MPLFQQAEVAPLVGGGCTHLPWPGWARRWCGGCLASSHQSCNDSWRLTVTLHWVGWRAGGTVAPLVHHHLQPLLAEHLLVVHHIVVLKEDLGHISHFSVTGLRSVPVEGVPSDVALWKALVDDVKKGAGDVGLHHLGMQRFQHLRHGTPISSSVLGEL